MMEKTFFCRYKTFMNNIVNENLAQASRGGIPGTYPLVRSFVGLRFQGEYLGLRDGVIDERPLWPMVSIHGLMSNLILII